MVAYRLDGIRVKRSPTAPNGGDLFLVVCQCGNHNQKQPERVENRTELRESVNKVLRVLGIMAQATRVEIKERRAAIALDGPVSIQPVDALRIAGLVVSASFPGLLVIELVDTVDVLALIDWHKWEIDNGKKET